MDFLNTNSNLTNCISARILIEPSPIKKSVGFAFFLSLADLENWAWNHSTHGSIYNTFFNDYVFKNFTNLRLYHEVGVAPNSKNLDLVYVNCHEKTGFLPFFPHQIVA